MGCCRMAYDIAVKSDRSLNYMTMFILALLFTSETAFLLTALLWLD
jgi:hypothetical protein